MKLMSNFILGFLFLIPLVMVVKYSAETFSSGKPLMQTVIRICLIGIVVSPLYFFILSLFSEFSGTPIYAVEAGLMKFSALNLSFCFFCPVLVYVLEEYL